MVKIGVVVAEFNYDLTKTMLERAMAHATFLGSEIAEVSWVPGVYDMPLAIKRFLDKGDVDAVVTLGAVIKGQTGHDQIVAQHASRKATDLAVEYGKPVSLGIIGPDVSRAEAIKRVDKYSKNAVESAVKMCAK